MNPASWAVDEMRTADFGDLRRRRRAELVLTALADHPASSIPDACGDWPSTKATYRFWDNEEIDADAVVAAHRDATLARCAAHATVLAVQDTTTLDFTQHAAMTGIGPLGQGRHEGLHVHTVLAVSPDGVPLGILHQEVWARDGATTGIRHQRRERATRDKESQRWLDGLERAQTSVPAPTQVVTVADREADIFDLFALPRPAHSEVLIRAAHDRRVQRDPTAYLWSTVRDAPVLGHITITVPRQAARPERPALLTLRVAAVHLHPPRPRQHDHALTPIPVTALLAEEPDPPAGQAALCWLLLTTLPIPDAEVACRCLDWYRHRWTIERFHYVLKSGCHIERLQLQTATRMERALATMTIVAWRVHWLAEQARSTPDTPCTAVLTQLQWNALYATIYQTTSPPPGPVSLYQAVRWIAQLGGFLARKGDSEPGVKTIWRGWRRLEIIAETWSLAHQITGESSCG